MRELLRAKWLTASSEARRLKPTVLVLLIAAKRGGALLRK
jgi:hypothetical protein